jgi:hypothetical protein
MDMRDNYMEHLSIELTSDGADAGEVDSASRALWDGLYKVKDIEVDAASGPIPANAKSAAAGVISTLAITILGSRGVANGLSAALRDWLTRYKTFKVKIKRGENFVEISGVKPSDVETLLPKLENLLK